MLSHLCCATHVHQEACAAKHLHAVARKALEETQRSGGLSRTIQLTNQRRAFLTSPGKRSIDRSMFKLSYTLRS